MGSKLEKLDTGFQIPYDEEALKSENAITREEALYKIIVWLQDILEKITVVSNYSTDLVDGEAIYYALKQSDGTYPDGTWRRIQVGDNLEDQVKIDGEWTFVQRRVRPT